MLNGSTLMLMALTTLTPAQLPITGPGSHAPVVVGQPHYALPGPVQCQSGPVAIPSAACSSCVTSDGYRCSGLLSGVVGPCAPSWNLAEKGEKLWAWLSYRSCYKTPCCFKPCDTYRPPLYEWFPKCVEGHPHAMPCMPAVNTCPSCLHLKPRFAPPPGCAPGCASCAPGIR